MDTSKPLKIKTNNGKSVRVIPAHKWFINRNTPVGEDAEIYEVMPYGGKRYIPWSLIIL